MPASTTTLTSNVRPVVAAESVLVKFVNRELFNIYKTIGVPELTQTGGSAVEWRVNRATGNSSVEVFSEGQAPLASGSQTWAAPSLSFVYHRGIVQISGHAMDQLKSTYLPELTADSLMGEISGVMDDLEDLYNTTFLGSTNNGMLIAVDSTGTYASLARASVTDWASAETAVGGVLTVAALSGLAETLRDNDRGAHLEAIIMPHNQITNYQALVGPENATDAAKMVRYQSAAGGGPVTADVGFEIMKSSFNQIPIYGCPDLTDTEILYLSDIKKTWRVVTTRPWHTRDLSINDDSAARKQISIGLTPVCLNPRLQGKLSGVTA